MKKLTGLYALCFVFVICLVLPLALSTIPLPPDCCYVPLLNSIALSQDDGPPDCCYVAPLGPIALSQDDGPPDCCYVAPLGPIALSQDDGPPDCCYVAPSGTKSPAGNQASGLSLLALASSQKNLPVIRKELLEESYGVAALNSFRG